METIMKQEDKTFEKIYDAKNFRNMGHEIIDLLADHLHKVQTDMTQPVYPYRSPEEELSFWQNDFVSETDTLTTFKNIIKHSMQLQHPRYIGHQTAVPAPVSILGGLLSNFLNNGTGVYEMGASSNAMEKVITDFTAKSIGYDSFSSGLLTSGGSLANLTALLAARKAKVPNDVWQKGNQNKLALIVSEEAHYSIDRAARILGLGDEGIIKIPINKDFKIRTELLNEYLDAARDKGLYVFAVIGCAGSTATGSYDDLEGMADFCQKQNLWFHVDGAHGGAVVFSKKYKKLVKGMHRADSIIIDYHKLLMTPSLVTGLLFKNGSNIYKTFAQKAQYLWDAPDSQDWYNSAKRTFECTKSLMSAKIYVLLKAHGLDVFEKNVDRLYESAHKLAELISGRSNFELAIQPESNIVNFRFIPKNTQNVNDLNSFIRKNLIESGKFYIVQTMINDTRYLRCTVMNPLTSTKDFVDLLDEIEIIGSR